MTRAKKSPVRTDEPGTGSGSPEQRPRLWRGRWVGPAAVGFAVLAAATVIWFQPQKLLYDQRVDEVLPSAVAEPSPAASGPPAPTAAAAPVELATGSFASREHETVGTARVLRLPDGRVILRFEGFATSNGPVLVVWLTRNSALGAEDAFDDEYVDLGPLKGNVGGQNYVVPADVDSTAYTSVVIWCDRFDVPFGAADLNFPN
ncbi:DM13 domain-containing protein [Blastococcus deserti]|uniref:DM13 domain-containing protein n=1 Tax=Blastococcus deserti TaxID=2259033 RepID=A0ABW4XCK5_9ACTN